MNYDPNQITAQEQLTESSSSNSTVWLIVGGIGCVFLLLMTAGIATVLILGYQLAETVADSQQKANANRTKAGDLEEIAAAPPVVTITSPPDSIRVNPNKPHPPLPKPLIAVPPPIASSIDEALDLLRTNRRDQREVAFNYLAKAENFDPDRREEVRDALTTIPNNYAVIPFEDATALGQWVTENDLLLLKQEVIGAVRSKSFAPLLTRYAELAGVEAAPMLANQLASIGGPLLEEIGPPAETAVVPYFNSSVAAERVTARDLLSKWNTADNLILRQCLKDVGADYRRARPARQFLLEFSGQIDAGLQHEISAKLETLFLFPGDRNDADLIELMGKYPSENTAQVLSDFLKSHKKSASLDTKVVTALGNIDSEVAVEAGVFAFFEGRATRATLSSLMSWDASLVAKAIIAGIDDRPVNTRRRVLDLLTKIDGAMPILVEKCTRDLGSNSEDSIQRGMELLARCKLDDSLQETVATAICGALDSVPDSTENYPLMKGTCDAAVEWGDHEVASRMIGYLDSPNSEIRRTVLQSVIAMQQPVAYPVISKQLLNKTQSKMVSRAISRLEPSADPTLLGLLDDPAFAAPQTPRQVLLLMARMGGEKSLEVLKLRVTEMKDPATVELTQAVIRTIEKRQQATAKP